MNGISLPATAIKALDELVSLLGKFLGPTAEEAGAIAGDRVRMFRLQQQLKMLRKAQQILKSEGINPREVKINVILPLLEGVSLEDDLDMADKWASLLASAADPSNESQLEKSFIEILRQLAPSHAFALDAFYYRISISDIEKNDWEEKGVSLRYLGEMLKSKVPEFDLAVDNLLRLRLVAYPTPKLGMANGVAVRFQVTSSDVLCPTNLGYAFYQACQRGEMKKHVYSVPLNSVSNVYAIKDSGSINLWDKQTEATFVQKHGKDGKNGWDKPGKVS